MAYADPLRVRPPGYAMPLTDTTIRSAKPRKLADERGLFLLHKPGP